MDLQLPAKLGRHYRSGAQRTRVITEAWASENLYCPACTCDSLEPTRPGTKVVDYRCDDCSERYQLKAHGRPIGGRFRDAAYEPMAQAVMAGSAPSFYFLHYEPGRWRLRNLQLVPRHFLSLTAIEKKPPLGPHARRAGWVGCDILLSRLPLDARIRVVCEEAVTPPSVVRSEWERFAYLREEGHESRGWTSEVLARVRQVSSATFTLQSFYREFAEELGRLSRDNRHVRDKIRQQLQVLRKQGILEFLGRGRYRQVRWCPECGQDLVPNALPRDGGGHGRLACQQCGAWLWE